MPKRWRLKLTNFQQIILEEGTNLENQQYCFDVFFNIKNPLIYKGCLSAILFSATFSLLFPFLSHTQNRNMRSSTQTKLIKANPVNNS